MQASFRRGSECIDRIFALRNIIKQCIEWNSPLFIVSIDFKKDRLSCDIVKILGSYGVPPKMVTLMGMFYHQYLCSVTVNGYL